MVGGVVGPLLLANSLDNQALLDAGSQLMGNPAAHIITAQVNDVFTKSGGCGLTMGLIIASLIVSRSKQMSSLTRMSFVPDLFNISSTALSAPSGIGTMTTASRGHGSMRRITIASI